MGRRLTPGSGRVSPLTHICRLHSSPTRLRCRMGAANSCRHPTAPRIPRYHDPTTQEMSSLQHRARLEHLPGSEAASQHSYRNTRPLELESRPQHANTAPNISESDGHRRKHDRHAKTSWKQDLEDLEDLEEIVRYSKSPRNYVCTKGGARATGELALISNGGRERSNFQRPFFSFLYLSASFLRILSCPRNKVKN
jgi:hypothetical protein